MANDFDRIFKENVEPTLPILAKLLFGIQYTSVEEVKDKMQFTLEREPDFLKKVYIAASTQLELIQFEFQSQNEDKIDARMLVYYALEYEKYNLPVRQFVIYTGYEPLKMPHRIINHPNLQYRVEVKDIREIPYEKFIESDKPEEVILAILGGFHGVNPEKVIDEILAKLVEVSKKVKAIGKFTYQLRTLAKLRKLREITIKKLENMPLIIELTEQEIQTDPFFKKGLQKGLEKKDAELIEIIQTSLLKGLSIDLISEITKVDIKTIKKIQRAMNKKK